MQLAEDDELLNAWTSNPSTAVDIYSARYELSSEARDMLTSGDFQGVRARVAEEFGDTAVQVYIIPWTKA